ncbi:MAG: asparagine synthase (glutamine-hydrolyzing) [Pseudomonadales bacterium]|nr:asparagine synthase (glutamine-hydrolyzing) [Pseudomonadales bacterium]
MCGIAGAVGSGDAATLDSVGRMLAGLVHRGPDQDGLWSSECATLGHRRLSILDLSEAGRQPMLDAVTGMVIVFNGEVYNFPELRRELEGLGRQFRSSSDTEVVLAAIATWGSAAIERLRGMFALAIWDPRDRTLLIARDRLGIKPLYYVTSQGRFWFASELRALLAVGLSSRRIDPDALGSYLWHGFVPGPRTIVDGISLLPPAHIARIASDGKFVELRRYWAEPASIGPGPDGGSMLDAAEELENAVKLHLVSDVPLGVFLSGGVDSSVLAALAQRHAEGPIQTFNVRFEEAGFDESPYARDVARRLGTDHHEVVLSHGKFAAHLEDALSSIDQPTFDAINSYFVSRAVREAGLKVALAGTGGDELFGGYSSFVDLPRARHIMRLAGLLPKALRRLASRTVSQLMTVRGGEVAPQTRWGKLEDLAETRGDRVAMYQVSYGLFTRELLAQLMVSWPKELIWGLYPERWRALQREVEGDSDLRAVSRLEIASFLGDRLLRDTDAASMAVSLEVRVPFLDHCFIDKLARVSDTERYLPIRRKMALRAMVAQELDPRLFDRPKAGFELPLGVWSRSHLSGELSETFHDLKLAQSVGVNGEVLGRLWRSFGANDAGFHWSRIWGLYVLMDWCRRHRVVL